MDAQKIMITGNCGSGKSHLSRKLGALLGLPVIHLDEKFWLPSWTMPDMAEWMRTNKKLVAEEQWIIDGGYGSTMVMRIKAADLIIYLNMPTSLCLYRITKRTLRYWRRTRPDMAENCKERFDWKFYKYVYNFKKDTLPTILRRFEKYGSDKEIVMINSPKELKQYLKQLERSTAKT